MKHNSGTNECVYIMLNVLQYSHINNLLSNKIGLTTTRKFCKFHIGLRFFPFGFWNIWFCFLECSHEIFIFFFQFSSFFCINDTVSCKHSKNEGL